MTALYNELTVTRWGPMLANRNDAFVGQSLFRYGEFSPSETALFRTLVDEHAFVVEVGANIGALTVPLARHARRVVAIEPQRIPFQTLCANVQLNSLDNVWAFQMACGDHAATVPVLDLSPWTVQNFGGARLEHALPDSAVQVPLVRLDDFLMAWLEPVTLLKIDAEGMEQAIMEGGKSRIAHDQPILYFENAGDAGYDERVHWVERTFGYRVFQHLPPLYEAGNFRNATENVFVHPRTGTTIVSENCIGVPVGSPLVEQLEQLAEREAVMA